MTRAEARRRKERVLRLIEAEKVATAIARTKWGPRGYASAITTKDPERSHRVGVVERDPATGFESFSRFVVYGRGATYEAAFADADRRAGVRP